MRRDTVGGAACRQGDVRMSGGWIRKPVQGVLVRAVIVAALLCLPTADSPGAAFKKRPRMFSVGHNPSAIVAHDLNGDGLPEIVTADRGAMTDPREERPANDELSLLVAQDGLDYVKHHPSLKTDFGPYNIAIANIDALKWPDIVVVSFHAVRHRHVNLFLNLKPEGIFETVDFRIPEEGLEYVRNRDGDGAPLFTTPGLTSVAIHDLNGDGLRDLVASAWSSDALVLMRGHGEEYFDAPEFIPAPGGPRAVRLADLNKDGHTDIAVVLYATAEIALWEGDGQGHFEPRGRFATRGRLPTTLQIADMNRDGFMDLVVSHCHADDSVVVFFGDGEFRFGVSQELALGTDREILEQEIRDIAIGDFNGDARPDLAVACYASGQVAVLLSEEQDGGRPLGFQRENYRFEDAKPRALCVADFDGNGNEDVAVALWEADAVGLLMNQRAEEAAK